MKVNLSIDTFIFIIATRIKLLRVVHVRTIVSKPLLFEGLKSVRATRVDTR